MKAERETLVIFDADTLFAAKDKILEPTRSFPELEKALDFLYKMVIEYRIWLAYNKETSYPMTFHQDIAKKKIWTIKFEAKKSTSCAQKVEPKEKT